MIILAIGYAAALLEVLMGMPQAIQSFKQRNDDKALAGVSLPSMVLMFIHTLMWVVYAVATTEIPVLLAHAFSLPVYGSICFFVYRSRRRTGNLRLPGDRTQMPLT